MKNNTSTNTENTMPVADFNQFNDGVNFFGMTPEEWKTWEAESEASRVAEEASGCGLPNKKA